MGEPKIHLDTHHSERDDLLEYQSFISSMVVDTVFQHQNISSQQPSTDVTHPSTADIHDIPLNANPSMDIPSTANPSTDISYPLPGSSSMDIPSSSNPSLNDNVLSHLGTSYEEQIVISTLLGLSEGELKMSEGLSCSQEKGEDVCEKPLISSEMVSKDEGTILVAEEKGEGVRESQVSQDEILMQKQRENERKAGTEAKLLKFAQELTEELIKDTWGAEGPVLSTIAEGDEGASDTKSVDSAQQDLDAISREPQEFTHPLPAYQVLASQSNQQAEQTLGLVHTEQSLRNAKASMASASTSAAPTSDSEERDNTEEETDEEAAEEAEWIDAPFFPVEHVLEEYKSQAKKAMKEPMMDDHVHKKLSSSFMETLKLQKMQYISLHSDLKNVKDEIESTKSKQKALFDERLPAYTMLTMDRKLKAESKIELRMDQLEGRVGKVEEKLQLLVSQATQTNELLVKLLEAQNSNPNDNKKGEKDESLSKPQAAQAPTVVPLNPNTEAVKTKRKSTHTEKHEERKRQKLTAEEKRLEREAAMILEKQEHERKLADFKSKTKEITEAAKAGKLKEVVETI